MKTFLVALVLAALIVAGVVVAGSDTCKASDLTASRIIELTNQNRTTPVVEDQLLDKAAQAKANDMSLREYFAHIYYGRTGWDFIHEYGITYLIAGENLAVGFKGSESLMKAWMNSPGHRANIVDSRFNKIGIGVSSG